MNHWPWKCTGAHESAGSARRTDTLYLQVEPKPEGVKLKKGLFKKKKAKALDVSDMGHGSFILGDTAAMGPGKGSPEVPEGVAKPKLFGSLMGSGSKDAFLG